MKSKTTISMKSTWAVALLAAALVAACAETDEGSAEAPESAESAQQALEAVPEGPFDFGAMLQDAERKTAKAEIRRCARGSAEACYKVGLRYHGGRGGITRDNPLSVRLIDHACSNGFTRACYEMGARYFQGAEVEQNLHKARPYFEGACDEGYPEACHMLGRMAKKGLGGPRNIERARRLFQHSCKLGFERDCERDLTILRQASGEYESRLSAGASDKLVEAARKCDAGLMSGCTNLARAYEVGEGVEQSFERAEELYRVACDWGKLDACSVYRMMEGTAHRFPSHE